MSQLHHIQTLEVQITGGEPTQVHRLQQELGQVIQERIVPLIDRFCSETCDPDTLIRLDTLLLDAGELDGRYFHRDLVAQVRRRLQAQLIQAIRKQQGATDRVDTQAELLDFFVQTGALPWWADGSEKTAVEHAVAFLREKAPSRLRQQLLDYLRRQEYTKRLAYTLPSPLLMQVLRLLQTNATASEQALIATLEGLLAAPSEKGQLSIHKKAPAAGWSPNKTEPKAKNPETDLALSAVDELYVYNAGLVLLWSFLPRFFETVELVKDKQFVEGPISANKAAALLQYLADGNTEPPEYQLVLNKALCGLPLEMVFEPPEAPAPEILAAADALLEAVITHATSLGKISVDGFRRSFLQRKGILSFQDGHWLLQVERQSFDILLDQLPWSFRIVKLPWMEYVLQVEW